MEAHFVLCFKQGVFTQMLLQTILSGHLSHFHGAIK
jgi:hypothetical protein